MTPEEKAIEYFNAFAKHTITFIDTKQCALITARELRNQYEIEDDPAHYNFWNHVVIELNMMQP